MSIVIAARSTSPRFRATRICPSSDPATGELIGTYPEHHEAETIVRLQRAWEGCLRWSHTPLHERRAFLIRLADLLDGRAETFRTTRGRRQTCDALAARAHNFLAEPSPAVAVRRLHRPTFDTPPSWAVTADLAGRDHRISPLISRPIARSFVRFDEANVAALAASGDPVPERDGVGGR